MSFGLLSPVAGGASDPESGLPASFVGVTDSGLPVYRVRGEEFVQFPPRPVSRLEAQRDGMSADEYAALLALALLAGE